MTKPKYPRCPDYTGGKIWRVKYRDRGYMDVLAPTWQEALVTAAMAWGIRWQDPAYHLEATCVPMGHLGKKSPELGGITGG